MQLFQRNKKSDQAPAAGRTLFDLLLLLSSGQLVAEITVEGAGLCGDDLCLRRRGCASVGGDGSCVKAVTATGQTQGLRVSAEPAAVTDRTGHCKKEKSRFAFTLKKQ